MFESSRIRLGYFGRATDHHKYEASAHDTLLCIGRSGRRNWASISVGDLTKKFAGWTKTRTPATSSSVLSPQTDKYIICTMRFLAVILLIVAATTSTTTRPVVGIDVVVADDDAMATRGGGACSATDADGTCIGAYPSIVDDDDNDDGDDGGEEEEDDYDGGEEEDGDGEEVEEDEDDGEKIPSVIVSPDEADGSALAGRAGLRNAASCPDKDEKCAAYAASGACESNRGYMTHNCASSCGTCDSVVEAAKAAEFADGGELAVPCMDDHYQCMEWAGMGECEKNPG